MKIFAADIGGTAIKISISDENGNIELFREIETESLKGGQYIIQKLVHIIAQYPGIDAISISTAGQVNSKEGYIVYANENIPGYTGTRIKDILEERFNVAVKVENDVNAAALGEKFYGAGKDYQDFIFLTFGTGIGGAIVIDSKLHRGFNGVAGEFGHMIVHPYGLQCNCGKLGCYECYGSTTALILEAQKINSNCTNGRALFNMIESGDESICNLFDKWTNEVALGIASLVHIFNPPCVIIGGGIMEQELSVKLVSEKVHQLIMDSFSDVKILKSKLGNKAGLFGAISLHSFS
ncbi:ROK family protein [Ferdinandcohnia quinoae]|uniref:ROK family protein n=1 Tax=Fredinandcohnia quinoae TaxID=2918902 RepID=A0AAW5DVX6_9BACI|nr:ROK family protein [Fredinandcohnia sp. SECRCQ15]MCH1624503.1 ROK family protein [Fredinandcohnia sp. SECRCQ15]